MARHNNTKDEVWKQVKDEYITSNMSLKEVTDKYGMSLSAAKRRCNAEKWTELRTKYRTEADKITIQKLAEKRAETAADTLEYINEVGRKLIKKCDEATEQLRLYNVKSKERMYQTDEEGNKISIEKEHISIEEGILNALAAQQIANTLKTIKEIVADTDETDESAYGVVMLPEIMDEQEDSMAATEETD